MKMVTRGCVVAIALLAGLGLVVAVMGEPSPSRQATPPSKPPLAPKAVPAPLAPTDRWTKATMQATAADVPGFTKRSADAWQNDVGAGVRAAYVSNDGYSVLLVGTWNGRDSTRPDCS